HVDAIDRRTGRRDGGAAAGDDVLHVGWPAITERQRGFCEPRIPEPDAVDGSIGNAGAWRGWHVPDSLWGGAGGARSSTARGSGGDGRHLLVDRCRAGVGDGPRGG